MEKTVAVIDGNSLMHRAYHAVGAPMNAADGTPTNAVFGFLSMLLKFIDLAKPDALVCAFDCGKPQFRIDALEQYKAQRPPMDQELRVQFPLIEELLVTLHIPVVKLEGWEGDDILGTIAALDEARGYRTLLVTGDKDAYQLTSALTRVVTTKKGMTDIAIYGPDEVYERYGVTASQFIDYLGLMGDTADNIPGVPGIGPKNASKLLASYGSIDGIYEHIDELKGKQRENLEANRALAEVSRTVATIMRNAPVELDIDDVAFPAYTAEEAHAALGRLGIASHLKHLLRIIDADAAAQKPEAPACIELSWEPIMRGEEAYRLLADAAAGDECIGISFLFPEQISLFEQEATVAFACGNGTAVLAGDEAIAVLADAVRNRMFAAADAKELYKLVLPPSSVEPAAVDPLEAMDARCFDVCLASYVADSNKPHALDDLAARFLGGTLPELQDDVQRAALRAAAARALRKPLADELAAKGALEVFERIDVPLTAVLAIMERNGAALNADRLAELSAEAHAGITDLTRRIFDLAGEEFNIDSPSQLSTILFEKMGLKHGKKTQRGYSTDASVLGELAKTEPIAAEVLRYRELAKIKSTYMDALPKMRGSDGRVHTSFNQMVTTTGRLSSSEPNLQNIPVRTDFGRQIRECFVPLRAGDLFVSADYSQIELRLLAHLSGDPAYIAAFNSGADFHSATASTVFGVPASEVTPQQRSRAKAVNFGIVYGQQSFGLSQSLGIAMGEAQAIIDAFYDAFPGVGSYLQNVVARAKETGYAETMFGRRRYIPELAATNANRRAFGERTAMNHPMQGSAADIIKIAMAGVQRRLLAEGFHAKLMLQVHDELDFSCPPDEIERLTALVKETMESVAELSVPLIAEVSWGENWARAH